MAARNPDALPAGHCEHAVADAADQDPDAPRHHHHHRAVITACLPAFRQKPGNYATAGLDRTPFGMRWDKRNFPLHLAALLQAACNVTCSARVPTIITHAWQMDTVAIQNAVASFVKQQQQQQRRAEDVSDPDGTASTTPRATPMETNAAAPRHGDDDAGAAAAAGAAGSARSAVATTVRSDDAESTAASVNEPDAFGMTAAHMAIFRGDVLTFKALLGDPVRLCCVCVCV